MKDKLHLEMKTYETALKGNGCILTSAKMGEQRAEFFDNISDVEFETLIWRLLGETKISIWLKESIYNIKSSIKSMFRR